MDQRTRFDRKESKTCVFFFEQIVDAMLSSTANLRSTATCSFDNNESAIDSMAFHRLVA